MIFSHSTSYQYFLFYVKMKQTSFTNFGVMPQTKVVRMHRRTKPITLFLLAFGGRYYQFTESSLISFGHFSQRIFVSQKVMFSDI